jgi:hypothetical protein
MNLPVRGRGAMIGLVTVIPGREANPESRDSGFVLTHAPE